MKQRDRVDHAESRRVALLHANALRVRPPFAVDDRHHLERSVRVGVEPLADHQHVIGGRCTHFVDDDRAVQLTVFPLALGPRLRRERTPVEVRPGHVEPVSQLSRFTACDRQGIPARAVARSESADGDGRVESVGDRKAHFRSFRCANQGSGNERPFPTLGEREDGNFRIAIALRLPAALDDVERDREHVAGASACGRRVGVYVRANSAGNHARQRRTRRRSNEWRLHYERNGADDGREHRDASG